MRSVASERTRFTVASGGRGGLTGGAFRTSPALLGSGLVLPGFGRRNCSRFRQRRAALDADFEGGGHVLVQPQFDIMVAQRADCLFQMDLPLLECDVELRLQLVGNHAGSNRPEHLAVLASLDRDDA